MSAGACSQGDRAPAELCLRPGLKERFLREFTASERRFFLTQAREALYLRGYRSGEDLFFYCYFLTLKERLRSLRGSSAEGCARYLLVEGSRDLAETVKAYEDRLEKGTLVQPDRTSELFIDYFAGESGPGSS